MPYQKRSDLPDPVWIKLSKHVQDIYKKAYNSVWDEYAKPKDRKGNASRKETAHKVAWAVVKKI